MKRTVPVTEAVGMVLPHDITEIRLGGASDAGGGSGSFKGRAFKKGHIVRPEDIAHLQRLGKEHLYVLELQPDEIHEDEAAILLAAALSGSGTITSGPPKEGKINILAAGPGLLKVDQEALLNFNLVGEVMAATLHSNTVVREGEQVGATRLIPLLAKRAVVEEAVAAVAASPGVIRVLPLRAAKVGLVITGNEVFHGRIKDAFEPILCRKMAELGSTVVAVRFAPDEIEIIAQEIKNCLAAGADLIVTSGGMSVDPDDVTRLAIGAAGASACVYGSAALPGAMFLVGYLDAVPILGVPACGMFHRITVLDLILPRVLAGERIGRRELALLGHGGLCRNCPTCNFPICSFGK